MVDLSSFATFLYVIVNINVVLQTILQFLNYFYTKHLCEPVTIHSFLNILYHIFTTI